MSSIAWTFIISFFIWFYFTVNTINNLHHLTQQQKKYYQDAFEYIAIAFGFLLFVEVVAVSIASEYFEVYAKSSIYPSIFMVNLFLIFLFRNKQRENNKKTYAKQKQNFNLPIQKVEKVKILVKHETDIDMNYYHIVPVFKKNDMTVESLELAKYTNTEYDVLIQEAKKPFEAHLVYRELIGYFNRKGEDYGIKAVSYDVFLERFSKEKRVSAEFAITSLFLQMIDKRIPIRISQLLQHSADRRYLKNYLYFLMGLESERFASNGVLYAMLHINHHRDFQLQEKSNEK